MRLCGNETHNNFLTDELNH
jgi:hypothetical protein